MDISLSPTVSQSALGQATRVPVKPNLATANDKAMRAAAQEFEAVFIGQMTEAMFAGIKNEEPFGGGHAENMWRSQLSQEMGRSVAASGGIGIADSVYRSMVAQQESAVRALPQQPAPIDAITAYTN